jgi:hypothetical protein
MKFHVLGFIPFLFALLFISIGGSIVGVPKSIIAVINLLLFAVYVAGWIFPVHKGYVRIGE